MPGCLPSTARELWKTFVVTARRDGVTIPLALTAGLQSYLCYPDPKPGQDWEDAAGTRTAVAARAAGLLSQAAVDAGQCDELAGIVEPISAVDPGDLSTELPDWLWPEAAEIWRRFVEQTEREGVNLGYALCTMMHFWNQHRVVERAGEWDAQDNGHGAAYLEVAPILAPDGVAHKLVHRTPGGPIEDVAPRPDDGVAVLSLLPPAGKLLQDRFLAACKIDRIEPERAAAAAIWCWLTQEGIHQPEDWMWGDDENLRARALRGYGQFLSQVIAGKVDDGQDTGEAEETEEATPAEG